MRKLSYALAASLLVFGLAGQSHAVVLSYTGGLSVQISTLDPVVLPGSGFAFVNGSNGGGHLTNLTLAADVFAVNAIIVPVTDPGAFPIAGVQVTAHNGTGVFSGSGGAGFGGAMPILGDAKVCLFGACGEAVANLTVPLNNVGAGGTALVTGAVNLTVIGAPWTTGTASAAGQTLMGGVAPGSNTGAPSGTITLVTPIFISTNIGASSVLPAFGILTLHFVPEPGTLLLLGSGIAGLVAFGRNRANA
jgi:hypothetical protein